MYNAEVTIKAFDKHKYETAEEARTEGDLQEFVMEMDIHRVISYTETLIKGMRLQAVACNKSPAALIVQMKI